MSAVLARSYALALVLAAACGGEPTKPSATPDPAASAAPPVECPSRAPDGGVCPTGCEQIGEKCLKPKGIIAPH